MSEQRIIFAQGIWPVNSVTMKIIPSTWTPTKQQREIVHEKWPLCPPELYDGSLWRYEKCREYDEKIEIQISKCSYKWHYILKQETYNRMEDYPNLLSVTPLILSKDSKVFLGVRQGHDQPNVLHAVGAGFIDPLLIPNPEEPSQWEIVAETPFQTACREIQEESTLFIEKDFRINDMELIGIVHGNNKDTTCVILVPTNVESNYILPKGEEHSHTFYLHISQIDDFLANETLPERPEVKATDHLVLALLLLKEHLQSQ